MNLAAIVLTQETYLKATTVVDCHILDKNKT